MLRSAVPPHMGQSPLPGSEPSMRTPLVAAASTAMKRTASLLCELMFRFEKCWATKARSGNGVGLLVRCNFQIVEIRAELHIHEYAWIPLPVADRIVLLNGPGRRLG